ncbi:MAG: DinB family protein [Bacteroidota bacterium]
MRKHFRKLFKYNNWANQKYLICLEQEDLKSERAIELYGHIISAQIIWLLRIKGLPTSPFPIWEKYKIRELKTMTEESMENWLDYMEEHRFETFEEMVFYTNSKGKKYENTIGEIITHVITHGTYHRAQLAQLFRQAGLEPPRTDFIAFAREPQL